MDSTASGYTWPTGTVSTEMPWVLVTLINCHHLSFSALWAQHMGFVVKKVSGEINGWRSFGLHKNFRQTSQPKQTLTADLAFYLEGQDS